MKKTIKVALIALLSSAAFTTIASAKDTARAKDEITVTSLPSLKGIDIKVNSTHAKKAVVMIYDSNDNVIYKDRLPAYKSMEKGYVLNQLAYGDYTIEVLEHHHIIKKEIHVYEDGGKTFLIKQS